MSKIKSIAALVALAAAFSFSQDDGGFKIGVTAGLNLSTFSVGREEYDQTVEYGKGFGFYGGIAFDIPLSQLFYFQPGLMFIQKGMKDESTSYYGGTSKEENTTTITANYIEMPLIFSVKSSVAEGTAIRINAGPYLAFGIGDGRSENKWKSSGSNGEARSNSRSQSLFKEECSTDDDGTYSCEEFGRFDWGLSFGGGVQFGNVYVGIFYDYGLSNLYIRKTNREDYNDKNGQEISTRSVGINVGYFF